MRSAKALYYGIIVVLLLALNGAGHSLAAPLAQDSVWNVTYPTDGAVVSGEVTITGTATHANFNSYGLLYAAGPNPTEQSNWIPIVLNVQTMVVNGPLASWDTTQIPNGQYTLALAVYEVGNDTPNLHFVNSITVQNEAATPTPAPTDTPMPEETTDPGVTDPGVGPVVPTIEQPPTATPRPTATPDPGGVIEDDVQTPTEGAAAIDALFAPGALKEAFCQGAWIAVLIYVIGGLYLAAKAAWRYYRRQQYRSRVNG